jgi:subtilisin
MGFDNRIFIADMEPAAIEALRENPQVDKVEVEGMARIMGYDPILGYDPLVQNTDWGVLAVHPQGAWNKGLYGQNIKVCVIDTGIQKAHEVFWDGGQTVYKGGYNFIGHTTDPEDDHDHGTFCCSIVAAQHNGVAGSFRGIAPGVDLYACKVLDAKGSGSYANIAAAIDWCVTHGMDIISMSLGGGSSSSILQAACDNAWYNGLLLVAAAGNEGPAENTVTYPGKYMSVLAVAAVGYWDDVADFSSRGPEVEIAGPGRGIVGAWAGFTFTDYVVNGSGDRYIRASGTSAACPHVAAAAALMKHWYPLATNLDLRTWLRDNARDI